MADGSKRVEYPEVQPGNFGFCDLCIETGDEGKYEITVYVDRASIKAGKRGAINDALQKMQGAIKLVGGKQPVIHSVIVVESEDFLGDKYSDNEALIKLTNLKSRKGITCFFVNRELTTSQARWGSASPYNQKMIVSTTYLPEEIKFTAVHEFGHMMGLAANHKGKFTNEGEARGGHCTVPECTMRDVVGNVMNDGILNINYSKEVPIKLIWENLEQRFRLVRKKEKKKGFRWVRKKFRWVR